MRHHEIQFHSKQKLYLGSLHFFQLVKFKHLPDLCIYNTESISLTFSPLPPGIPATPLSPGIPPGPAGPGAPAGPTLPGSP